MAQVRAEMDGLQVEGNVSTDQLADLLKQVAGIQPKYPLPDSFNAAVVAGGYDNVSVVLVRV